MALSSDLNPPCAPLVMGGYDCQFVKPPPDFLQCPICLLPFKDPVLLSCCGHKGCNSCIGRIKAAGYPCPICQQPFQTMLDKQLQRKVLDLRVFCLRKEEGCPWEGELRDQETHSRRDCGYVEEACRYGCGQCYQQRLLRDHEMNECPKRPPEIITQSLIRKMTQRMEELEHVHQQDQIKLVALQDSLTSVQGKLQKLERIHDEDQVKLVALEKAHCEDQKKMNLKIQDLQKQIDSLQNKNKSSTNTPELGTPTGPIWLTNPQKTPSSECVPCTVTMPHFSKHKLADNDWYSGPFYSAQGGYKLSLRVYANGQGSGAGTHISVFAYLMRGEDDHRLQWPFEHCVTYRILNWRNNANHKMDTIFFKNAPTTSTARVTSGERAVTGWGHSQALPHALLFDSEDIAYVVQDCLCVQVLKVEPPK